MRSLGPRTERENFGFQAVVVDSDGSALSMCRGIAGDGQPVAESDLFAIYCAGKPLLAVATLALYDACMLDILQPILRGTKGKESEVTSPEAILSHTTRIPDLHSILARYLSSSERSLMVDSALRHPAYGSDFLLGEASYNSYTAWHLLGEYLETLSGEPLHELVARLVIHPYGLEGGIGLAPAVSGTVRPNRWVFPSCCLPLWGEILGPAKSEWNPAFGYYANAWGLATFYRRVVDDARGAGIVLSAETARHAVSTCATGFSALLGRSCSFGLGFMTQLSRNMPGSWLPASAFGHTGIGGGAIGFGDVESGIAGAFIVVDLTDSSLESLRRYKHVASYVGLHTEQ